MKEGKLMKQINIKDCAESFGKIVAKCLQEGKYVGDWIWGNPAGQSGSLPTYEVHLGEDKIWCTSITWASAVQELRIEKESWLHTHLIPIKHWDK